MMAQDREIVALRSEVRQSEESRLAHGIIDTNQLLQEITSENQSRIDLSTHTLLMLKARCDLQFTPTLPPNFKPAAAPLSVASR